jgi:hypothetical protein
MDNLVLITPVDRSFRDHDRMPDSGGQPQRKRGSHQHRQRHRPAGNQPDDRGGQRGNTEHRRYRRERQRRTGLTTWCAIPPSLADT